MCVCLCVCVCVREREREEGKMEMSNYELHSLLLFIQCHYKYI